jgi:hypothetical protein
MRMANLARIQWDMQEFLLRGSGAIDAHVIGTSRVPADVRLAIYSNAYASRLTEALEANYPAVAKLLGERDFQELATEYIAAHDSRFFSIRYYGHSLAQFLASNPRYKSVPFLAELARWEWTMNDVFDSADAEALQLKALAYKSPGDWASMRFTFHPSVRSIALNWNAPQVWKALMNEADRPRATVSREATCWLLWRQELKEFFRPLGAAEEHALVAARAGENFGEICTVLCEHMREDEAPARAAEYLRSWIESGVISALA